MEDPRTPAPSKHSLGFAGVLSVWCLAACAAGAGGGTPPHSPRVDQFGDLLPEGAVARLGTGRWRLHESMLAFSPDGRYAIATGETTRLVDATTGKVMRAFPLNSSGACFNADSRTVMLSVGEGTCWLNVETGKIVRKAVIDASRWSASGRHAVGLQKANSGSWYYLVWDTARAKELCRFDPGDDCTLSADGSLLAVRYSGEIGVFGAANKMPVCRWRSVEADAGRTPNARIILFLPDGKTLAATEAQRVRLWDPVTGRPKVLGKLPSVLVTANDHPVTLAASPDGRHLAAGSANGALYIWDVKAGTLRHTLPDAGKGLPVYTLNFTADGKRLVSQAHLFPSARVWDVASGKELTSTAVAASGITALAFSPDGKTIATDSYLPVGPPPRLDPVLLWDATTGKLVHRLGGEGINMARSFAWLPDGKGLITTWERTGQIWSVAGDTARLRAQFPSLAGKVGRGPIYQRWTPCCPSEGTAVVLFAGDVRGVVRRPGRLGGDLPDYWTMIGIADVRTGRVQQSFRIQSRTLSKLCLSPDRRLLAAVGGPPDGSVASRWLMAWELKRGAELFHADVPASYVCEHLAFSADSRAVLWTGAASFGSGREHAFRVFEIASGRARASFLHRADRDRVSSGAIARDDLAAVTNGPAVCLFDPLTGKELGRLETGQSSVGPMAFSPEGKRLACAHGDTTALIWDVARFAPAPAKLRVKEGEVARLWADLASPDAVVALRAIRQLVRAADQAVPYLSGRLQPASDPGGKIQPLLAQLDSDHFAQRQQAERELLGLADLAEPSLRTAARESPSPDVRRRAERLLAKLEVKKEHGPRVLAGEPLRQWRAVEVLERIGTPDARHVLEHLTTGGPHAVLTREARAAVQRLTRRSGAR
jgi:WD40 repeat protein